MAPERVAAGWRAAGAGSCRRALARATLRGLALWLMSTAMLGCAEEDTTPRGQGAGGTASLLPQQTREILFAGRRDGQPLATVFAFRNVDGRGGRSREARGWLGHAGSWETFLDERWASGQHGSGWTIVPHDQLRVAAGGANEVEAIWFERSGRFLRLEFGDPLAEWSQGPTERFHLFDASVDVGGEVSRGIALELLRVRRPTDDHPTQRDHLLLQSGDSVVLFVAVEREEGNDPPLTIAWLQDGSGRREWGEAQLLARGERALPEARREIPRRWSFVVPGAGIRGEVYGNGFAAESGAERAGRRAVEARYTVTGWMESGGRRLNVSGLARHAAD